MTKGYYIFVKSYKHPKTGKLKILTILTKEQYQLNCYVVEGENNV